MKQSSESANFILDHLQYNMPIGTAIEATQTVNMNTVLGDMYTKYKYFKIVLNCINSWGSAQSGNATYSPANTVSLGVTGLDFVNTTFDGLQTNMARFPGSFALPNNGSGNVSNFPFETTGVVFRRPNNPNQVNLKLSLINPRNTNPVTVSNVIASYSALYFFTIYGLYEDD